MLYAKGREKAEKKKKRAFESNFMSNADQNHQSCENGKKKGERGLRWHHYHFERARARGANVNDVIVLSQPPRPH